jgi:hypothetical protein
VEWKGKRKEMIREDHTSNFAGFGVSLFILNMDDGLLLAGLFS